MYFFLIIELFPLPVRLSFLKYLLWEKYCNYCYYPLTTAQDDRFATSCENIVSRSQTLSLLPRPPWWGNLLWNMKENLYVNKVATWFISEYNNVCKLHRGKPPSEKDFSTIFCRQSHCSLSPVSRGSYNGTDVSLLSCLLLLAKLIVLFITYSVSGSVDQNMT